MQFDILHKDKTSKARVGKIVTPHGIVETPAFVPVGTQATVKGLSPQDLRETGTQILFGNTYHLHLRPGEDVVKDFGGLGTFMGWNGPTITDSGGFQVFSLGRKKIVVFNEETCARGPAISFPTSARSSLSVRLSRTESNELRANGSLSDVTPRLGAGEAAYLVRIKDDGVEFRSHIDGSKHFFTPEKSIEIQQKLGADLILAFDECPPHPSTYEYTKEAMERTHRWAIRSLAEFRKNVILSEAKDPLNKQRDSSVSPQNDKGSEQALYGIIQGGIYQDLREASAKLISGLDFDGIAIGGVAVGETKEEMRKVLSWVAPLLPEEKPRHLLGIGEIDDIFDAVENGMDMFDCVIPTRFGRYGIVFASPQEGSTTNKFRIDLTKAKWANDKGPMTQNCECNVCTTYTCGYVRHLFRANELLAFRLASYHNLYFLNNLTREIREAIGNGQFAAMKKKWLGY